MIRRHYLAALLVALCATCGQLQLNHVWSPALVAEAASAPALSVTASVRFNSIRIGQKERLIAVVRSKTALGRSLVDFEVDDRRGARVYQGVKVVTIGANRPVTVSQTFVTAPSDFAGTYYFKIGVFSANWKRRYVWVNDAKSFTIHGRVLPHISAAGTIPAQRVYPRQAVTLTARVSLRGPTQSNLLIDIEIYHGATKVYQRGITGIRLVANSVTSVTNRWVVPANAPRGAYVMRVGVFGSRWSPLYAWNGNAMTFTVA